MNVTYFHFAFFHLSNIVRVVDFNKGDELFKIHFITENV